MSAEQKLIAIEEISEENAPAIYVAGGLKQFIDLVKAEVEGEVPDLTTRKGRERIASLAAKVSKSKTAVEKPGRDYLRRLKEMPKVVEAELREFVTKMDALRDETRRPLTEWEQAEADRVAAEQRAEQERQAAARRAEEAAEQARQDERRRADAAAAEILRQQEAREADKAHRASINRAALEAFIAEGMPEACAKQAVTLIAQRKIPNIAISY